MENFGVSYSRLFNTRIVNNFYPGSFGNADFSIAPTAATAQVMKNANLLFRNDDLGFRLLYRQSGSQPFVPFSNLSLQFEMTLKDNIRFPNVVDLSVGAKKYAGTNTLYFTNRGAVTTNKLAYRIIDYIQPAKFTFEFPQDAADSEDVGAVTITNWAGTNVTPTTPDPDAVAPDGNNKFLYPVDFSLLPKGFYTFETTVNELDSKTTYIYIDNDLVGRKPFGIIDIFVTNASDSSFPPVPAGTYKPTVTDKAVYDVAFVRRATYWKYIVVLNSPALDPGDTLAITYPSVADTANPYYPGGITFTRKTDIKVNNVTAAVFTSFSGTNPAGGDTRIPFYNAPLLGIKFRQNGDDLLTNLGGPPMGQVVTNSLDVSEIYIYI